MNEIEWACGFYDEFHQLLYEGEITLTEVIEAYKNKKITYIDRTITEETQGYYDTYKVESTVESTLNKIDDDLREIVILYYYDDMSVSEISEILNIPTGTVKSRLSRARKSIEEIIKREDGEIYD